VHRKRPCPEERAHGLAGRLLSPASPDHHRHHHQRAELEGDAPSYSGSKTRGKLVSLNGFPVLDNCYAVLAPKSPLALGKRYCEASLLMVLYFSYNSLILQERGLQGTRDRRGARHSSPTVNPQVSLTARQQGFVITVSGQATPPSSARNKPGALDLYGARLGSLELGWQEPGCPPRPWEGFQTSYRLTPSPV